MNTTQDCEWKRIGKKLSCAQGNILNQVHPRHLPAHPDLTLFTLLTLPLPSAPSSDLHYHRIKPHPPSAEPNPSSIPSSYRSCSLLRRPVSVAQPPAHAHAHAHTHALSAPTALLLAPRAPHAAAAEGKVIPARLAARRRYQR